MIIVKAASLLEAWLEDLPAKYCMWNTESGYANDEASLHWIEHYDRLTSGRIKGAWRALFCDGFGAYDTKQFIEYA
jgi:hypothetical protein